MIRCLAPSCPDVVVAHKCVGSTHFDQANVREAQPGSNNLSHLSVDTLPNLNATMGDIDCGIMLMNGDLGQKGC